MKHVKIEDDKCIIELNKTFYPANIIKKAIKTFNEAEGKDSKNQKNSKKNEKIKYENEKIIIANKDKDFAFEFCDYLLGIVHGGSSDGFERV